MAALFRRARQKPTETGVIVGFLLDLFEAELARRREERLSGRAPPAEVEAAPKPWKPVQLLPQHLRARALPTPAAWQWGNGGIEASVPKGDRDNDDGDWT